MNAMTLPKNNFAMNNPRDLAREFYDQMISQGYSPKEVLAASSEIVACITKDIKREKH